MKKAIPLMVIWMLVFLVGCQPKEEPGYAGLNAMVLEVDAKANGVYVKDADGTGPFGERCFLDCTKATVLYADFDADNNDPKSVKEIKITELLPEDKITVDLRESEYQNAKTNGQAIVEQIQLMTQRMNDQ